MVIALMVPSFWVKFCSAIERPELAQDPRFATTTGRKENRVELEALIGDVLSTRTTAEWQTIFDAADIPGEPVNTVAQALAMPIIAERAVVREVDHPTAGRVQAVRSPVRFLGRFEDAAIRARPAARSAHRRNSGRVAQLQRGADRGAGARRRSGRNLKRSRIPMATSAKAVVQIEQDGPLQIEEIRIPDPGPHQVLVRVLASGLCQSQIFWMHQPRQHGMLFGHEGYGVVARVGRDVTGLREGDHVIVTWLPREDGEARTPEVPIFHLSSKQTAKAPNVFTWADYSLVDELYVRPLPDTAREDVVSIVGCAVITGAGAVLNAASVKRGDTVAVFGLGGVGLSAVAAASVAGAERVVAIDLRDAKLELARHFGATDVVNASHADPVAAIHALLPGRCGCGPGAHVALDCVGLTETTQQALAATRAGKLGAQRGGRCVVVGVPKNKLEIDLFNLMATEKTLLGTMAGSCRQDQIDMFVEWFQSGRLDLRAMVTDQFRLDQIGPAVDALARGDITGRALVTM